MLDPFTSLSLAATIVQFLDVSWGLLSDLKEIHASSAGIKADTARLEALVDDIKSVSAQTLTLHLSEDEKELRVIAKSCEEIAADLKKVLKKLKVRAGKNRALESLRASIQGMMKSKEVETLIERLLRTQTYLQQRISALVREKNDSDFSKALQELQGSMSKHQISTHRRLNQVLEDVQVLLATREEEVRDQHEFFQKLHSQLISTTFEARRATKNHRIIASLWFSSLKERQDGIETAYEKTLDWLYDESRTPFSKWLESGEGIFWINGQAGSGKSTLMKFASSNKRSKELLRSWANTRTLRIANFYFWISGREIQKSKRGLLQTLLCQILRADPDLVNTVCPDHLPNEPWSIGELMDALKRLTDASISSCYCFFIDGLDEYSGDEIDIVSVLRYLEKLKNVKICTSSRPWPAFEQAFTDKQRVFVVQDHTVEDMSAYVRGMLQETLSFKKLVKRDRRCYSLIPEITKRANGVWLWVFLVVRDLGRDISGKEDYPILTRRLEELPTRLEEYFEQIISKIDKLHEQDAAKIFLTTLTALGPIPLSSLYCLELEAAHPDYAFSPETYFAPIANDIGGFEDKLTTKLKARCRDLLKVQVVSDPQYTIPVHRMHIQFLHRTVRDFLKRYYLSKLREQVPTGFDERVSLCRIQLVLFKAYTAPLSRPAHKVVKNTHEYIIPFVEECLTHAKELELAGKGDGQFKLLDIIDFKIKELTDMERLQLSKCAATDYDFHGTFLSIAAQYGLCGYLRYRAERTPDEIFVNDGRRPLLDHAIRPHRLENAGMHSDLVACLLSKGSDPNEQFTQVDWSPSQQQTTTTPFRSFVQAVRYDAEEPITRLDNSTCFTVAKLLVQHGARLDEVVHVKSNATNESVESPTARYTLRQVFTLEEMKELSTLAEAREAQELAKRIEAEEAEIKKFEASAPLRRNSLFSYIKSTFWGFE